MTHDVTGGSINIIGDLRASGQITVGGAVRDSNVTVGGTVTVGGKLAAGFAGAGRILVTGLCSGAISIGQETATATLIHLLEGLDLGASLVINADEGNFNANGDIHVGLISCSATPPEVTYDGCIRIYKDSMSAHGGTLNGDLAICDCHATYTDLQI